MTPDNFYWYASILIFIPWIALIAAPSWKYTEILAFVTAIVLIVVATWFTIVHLSSPTETGGHLFSFNGLKNIFRSSEMLLTGWLNYLAFSLLIGIWQVHDARQLKISHLFVIPSLLITMIGGAVGLLVYMVLRFMRTKKWEF